MPEFKSIEKERNYGADGIFFAQYQSAIIAADAGQLKSYTSLTCIPHIVVLP